MTKENKRIFKKYGKVSLCFLFLAIIITIMFFIVQTYITNIKSIEIKEEKKVCIEMDAVVSYSCKEYSVFSAAEFSSFVVFDEPLREYYEPVILIIDTKNTSNTIDDEVIKVKNRKGADINSTGGDIYGSY